MSLKISHTEPTITLDLGEFGFNPDNLLLCDRAGVVLVIDREKLRPYLYKARRNKKLTSRIGCGAFVFYLKNPKGGAR